MSLTYQIADSTKKNYLNNLRQCQIHGIDIDNITNVTNVISILSIYYEMSSIRAHLNALLWYSKLNNKNANIVQELHTEIIRLLKISNNQAGTNVINEKELNKFIKWSDVLLIHEKIKLLYENNKNNKKLSENYLILSLYVLMPPRRILDYIEMYIDPNQIIKTDKVIPFKNTDYIDELNMSSDDVNLIDNKNYYIATEKNCYFKFDNYKTKNSYSCQYLELNPDLANVINEYILLNQLKTNDKLLNLKHGCFIMRLQKIFRSYVNINVSASVLRHAYIMYLRDNEEFESYNHKKKIAKQMAHAVSTQEKYYKKTTEDDLKKTINDDGDIKLLKNRGGQTKYNTPDERREAKRKIQAEYLKRKKEKLIIH